MLSKEQIKELLEEVKALEKNMQQRYLELSKQVETPYYQEQFQSLASDEQEHFNIVNNLQSRIDKQLSA
ncbi:MAG: ferritin family protein [Chlamydiota bacterium]